jgi:hypothetical protein
MQRLSISDELKTAAWSCFRYKGPGIQPIEDQEWYENGAKDENLSGKYHGKKEKWTGPENLVEEEFYMLPELRGYVPWMGERMWEKITGQTQRRTGQMRTRDED